MKIARFALPALAVVAATVALFLLGENRPLAEAPVGPSAPESAPEPLSESVQEPVSEPAPEASSESFLYALQNERGTQVTRLTPAGNATPIFDDRGTAITIHNLDMATRLVATGTGRLFAYAKPRTPSDRDFFPRGETVFRTEAYRTYVFELSTDGSNEVREVAEVLGTQSPRRFLVSPAGERIAYFNVDWVPDDDGVVHERHWIYVHDTSDGEQIAKIDAGLSGYDAFKGAAWLDEATIYLWRLPEEEVHADQDLGRSAGAHLIDVPSGVETALESEGFLGMLDEEERTREGAAPECSALLGPGTLLCNTNGFPSERDAGCRAAIRERRVFTFDLEQMQPTLRLSTGPVCADRWLLSPSAAYAVGLETVLDGYAVSGRRLLLSRIPAPGSEAVVIATTASPEQIMYPVGWTTH